MSRSNDNGISWFWFLLLFLMFCPDCSGVTIDIKESEDSLSITTNTDGLKGEVPQEQIDRIEKHIERFRNPESPDYDESPENNGAYKD